MNEAESYMAKEDAKAQLLSALLAYIGAAKAHDMNDSEQAAEIEDVFDEAGKPWNVTER